VFDQWGELPLLPFGNPIGFVPASRGGVNLKYTNDGYYIKVIDERKLRQLSYGRLTHFTSSSALLK